MAAVSGAVAGKNHGLAVHYPFGVSVGVAALGEVEGFFLAIGGHKGDVGVVPSAHVEVFGQQPAAVGAPGKILVAVAIGIGILAVHGGIDFAAFEVDYTQGDTVFQIGHLFAVGAILRLETGSHAIGEAAFLGGGTIGHLGLLVAGYL